MKTIVILILMFFSYNHGKRIAKIEKHVDKVEHIIRENTTKQNRLFFVRDRQ